MTKQELEKLQAGDIVTNTLSGNGYVVLENLGDGVVVAVRSVTVTNPAEWKLVRKDRSRR